MGDKIYKCQICDTTYDENEAEMLSYECCEEDLVYTEANPEQSGDGTI